VPVLRHDRDRRWASVIVGRELSSGLELSAGLVWPAGDRVHGPRGEGVKAYPSTGHSR
jgi:hypothetical protein